MPYKSYLSKMLVALRKTEINPKLISLPDKCLILYCLMPTWTTWIE